MQKEMETTSMELYARMSQHCQAATFIKPELSRLTCCAPSIRFAAAAFNELMSQLQILQMRHAIGLSRDLDLEIGWQGLEVHVAEPTTVL